MTVVKAELEEQAANIDRAIPGITLVYVLDRNATNHAHNRAIHWKTSEGWKSVTG